MSGNLLSRRASFPSMREISGEDCAIVEAHLRRHAGGLGDRVLAHMALLDGDHGGYAVTRLEHCLQTASRALQDGRDEEYVVCALLHDIGDTLASHNHADMAAVILQPFVSERMLWIVKNHSVFQGYYMFHFVGMDRHVREAFRGHPAFDDCAEFCELYDQRSFDPRYGSLPLSVFEPMVRRLFAAPLPGRSALGA